MIRDGTAGQVRATFDTNGNLGIGTTLPQSTLLVATGYVQIPFVMAAPAAGDCNANTLGRVVIFANAAAAAQIYICDSDAGSGSPSWVVKQSNGRKF